MPSSELARRKPSRISATLLWHLDHRLEERAAYEGRSLSNLTAHLLEGGGVAPKADSSGALGYDLGAAAARPCPRNNFQPCLPSSKTIRGFRRNSRVLQTLTLLWQWRRKQGLM